MAELEPTIIHGDDLATDLAVALRTVAARRILLITGPSRRFVDRVTASLRELEVEVFDQARVHVPADVVARASEALREHQADTIVTVGGGSATGLGKALRLEHEVKLVVVPTTYSGSEQTGIYGITTGSDKKTGRDPRVRPDVVLYEPSLSVDLPKRLTTQSLLNALAHPVGALSTGSQGDAARREALDTARALLRALEALSESPRSMQARSDALRATARAGAIIHSGKLGAHHRLAHVLGARFGLEHAAVHSLLLPHTVASLQTEQPTLFAELTDAASVPDLPGALFDLLRRCGAETSLHALGVKLPELEAVLAEHSDLPAALARHALHGGRPSVRVRLEDWGLAEPVRCAGPPPSRARRVLVALHGRGSNANDFVRRIFEIGGDAPDLCIVAPQAPGNQWYAKSYTASAAEHGQALPEALAAVDTVVGRVLESVDPSRIIVVGFSQGACLATEYVARSPRRLGGLVAFAGARIGPTAEQPPNRTEMSGMPVLLGASERDPWVPAAHIEATAAFFRAAGAAVEVLTTPGEDHQIAAIQRIRARELLQGRSVHAGSSGFGNALESEALEGALPREQNSPRRPAFGLYAEQVNATGFVAPRHENRRCWLYRIRPSAQHSRLEPLEHDRLAGHLEETPPEPNLVGWGPLPLPERPTDFVDGLATLGGAGSAKLRRGFAIHVYAANRSMEDRAFYNADGELLLVPQRGRLTLQTELGVLDVEPGQIAILPRGVRFSVMLRDETARGWLGEVYGRNFTLPERGPVGANGLTDARHFVAPTAYHEDRLSPGYRITAKFMDALFEATQDHSPYDVVAWHGNLCPYVYDLTRFSPVANVRVDHGDPSIFTVLSAPLDEQGAHSLDFVLFPARWDVTEHTFRPPYFHRNAVTEFNGIIRTPARAKPPFQAGLCYLTPSMTPHGVRVGAVERALARGDEQADRPDRHQHDSMWFQFETMLPMALSPWARDAAHRIRDWNDVWGAYRTHYDPPQQAREEPET
jgi:homogentisate 1,2-dioxygenase